MRIVVKLFAGAREAIGLPEVTCEIAGPANVEQLRDHLLAEYPKLEPLLPHTLFARDGEYMQDHTEITSDVEIACIPPVSGG